MRPDRRAWPAAWFALAVALVAGSLTGQTAEQVVGSLSRSRDERLQQKVSVRVAGVPLRTWLAQLGERTGVGLRVADDYEDLPVTVRVRDVPLGKLLDSIARLYGDYWTRRGREEASIYTLQASLGRRQKQQQLLQAYRRALQAELIETVRETAVNGPPEQLLGGPASLDGYDYAGELRGCARVLSHLTPEALDRLFAGESIRISLAQTTGPAEKDFREFLTQFAMPDRAGWTHEERATASIHFYADRYFLSALDDPQIQFLRGLPLYRLNFRIVTTSTTRFVGSRYSFVALPARIAARLERDLARLRRGEEQDPRERHRLLGSLAERRVPAEGPLSHPRSTTRSELLVTLAEALDLNLVGDAHTKPPLVVPPLGDRHVEEALDLIGRVTGCHWRWVEGIALFRSRYWWVEDVAEPPATAVVRWQELLKTEEPLPLDEAAAIASLAPEQQQRLALLIPEAESACNGWLRFYGSLDRGEREAAHSKDGLPLWRVDPRRRELLLGGREAEPFSPPLPGGPPTEEMVRRGAGFFRVVEKASVPTDAAGGASGRRPPAVISLQIDPVRDARGRPVMGLGAMGVARIITLPRRSAGVSPVPGPFGIPPGRE